MMIDTQQTAEPVAVPQTPAAPAAPPAAAVPSAPPADYGVIDDVFKKLHAERQQRIAEPPITVLFGGEPLRLYRHTPATAVFDVMALETDPSRIQSGLRAMVIEEDQPLLDEILARPGSHPGSVDDQYIGEFLAAIARVTGGRPLGG